MAQMPLGGPPHIDRDPKGTRHGTMATGQSAGHPAREGTYQCQQKLWKIGTCPVGRDADSYLRAPADAQGSGRHWARQQCQQATPGDALARQDSYCIAASVFYNTYLGIAEVAIWSQLNPALMGSISPWLRAVSQMWHLTTSTQCRSASAFCTADGRNYFQCADILRQMYAKMADLCSSWKCYSRLGARQSHTHHSRRLGWAEQHPAPAECCWHQQRRSEDTPPTSALLL